MSCDVQNLNIICTRFERLRFDLIWIFFFETLQPYIKIVYCTSFSHGPKLHVQYNIGTCDRWQVWTRSATRLYNCIQSDSPSTKHAQLPPPLFYPTTNDLFKILSFGIFQFTRGRYYIIIKHSGCLRSSVGIPCFCKW